MPTSRTKYKLEEAKFFLLLLEQNWRNFPHVDFFLSAFVSAARSVTWVMRAEYGNSAGWAEWFDARKPSSQTRDLLKRMNDVRVRATKSEPLRTQTSATVNIPPDEVTPELLELLRSGAKQRLRLEPTDPTNTEALLMLGDRILSKVRIETATHELPEFEGMDARVICRRYLEELDALLLECEVRFEI